MPKPLCCRGAGRCSVVSGRSPPVPFCFIPFPTLPKHDFVRSGTQRHSLRLVALGIARGRDRALHFQGPRCSGWIVNVPFPAGWEASRFLGTARRGSPLSFDLDLIDELDALYGACGGWIVRKRPKSQLIVTGSSQILQLQSHLQRSCLYGSAAWAAQGVGNRSWLDNVLPGCDLFLCDTSLSLWFSVANHLLPVYTQ